MNQQDLLKQTKAKNGSPRAKMTSQNTITLKMALRAKIQSRKSSESYDESFNLVADETESRPSIIN